MVVWWAHNGIWLDIICCQQSDVSVCVCLKMSLDLTVQKRNMRSNQRSSMTFRDYVQSKSSNQVGLPSFWTTSQVSSVQNPSLIPSYCVWNPLLDWIIRIPNILGSIIHYKHQSTGVLNHFPNGKHIQVILFHIASRASNLQRPRGYTIAYFGLEQAWLRLLERLF